uniref:YqhA family protein n=1 Tax=Candidatus Planktophila sp. TaxID=2175601 RepID=UPI004049722D
MNKLLARARYAVFIPALASIVGALLLMFQGSVAMVVTVIDVITEGTKLKLTIVEILTAVDAILLGTVLLVIGYGLYELFIDEDLEVPMWLQVQDLDDLKSKLIGVVVAIISVIFVGVFVDTNRASDVISYGVGAGAILTGLALFAFATRKDPKERKQRERSGVSQS